MVILGEVGGTEEYKVCEAIKSPNQSWPGVLVLVLICLLLVVRYNKFVYIFALIVIYC